MPRQGIQLTDCLVLGIYVLLALAFTWPAVTVAGAATLGVGTDGWQKLWEMWWMGQAIAGGSTPYHFATLFAPDGATNYLHSFNPIILLIALPVQWAFGVTVAYNVACWMALFFTAFAGYLLGRDITGNRVAGVVGGLALGFAPHQMAQLIGHVDVASIQFFVLGVWCLYRGFQVVGSRAVVWALWSAACLAASALSHPYSLASALIVMLLMGLYWTARGSPKIPRRQSAATTLLAMTVGLAVVSPLLLAMFQQWSGPNAPGRNEGSPIEVTYFSVDLLAYLLPSTMHPIWGKPAIELVRYIKPGNIENVVFVGYSVMALALVGVFARSVRARARFWWALAIVGLLLSLGPTLYLAGTNTGLPMPTALFYSMPGSSIWRVPARFSVLFMLGLSVCAALGTQALWERWVDGRRTQARRLMAILPLLVVLELFSAPYPATRHDIEPWFARVSLPQDGYKGVLEVPFDRGDLRPQVWQIKSRLPLAGGSLSRQPIDPLSSGVPPFTDFGLNRTDTTRAFNRSRDVLCGPPPGVADYTGIMRLAKVRYVVLHLDRLEKSDPRVEMAARLFPGGAIYQSKDLRVYDNGGGEPPGDLFGIVEDTQDWPGSGGDGFKWSIEQHARIHVWSGAEREARLQFKLRSFARERDVRITVGGRLLAASSVSESGRTYDLAWRVPQGFSMVLISAGGPGVTPASLGMNDDSRPLTLRLSDCSYSVR